MYWREATSHDNVLTGQKDRRDIGSMNLYGAESHAPFGDSKSHYLVPILSAAEAEGDFAPPWNHVRGP